MALGEGPGTAARSMRASVRAGTHVRSVCMSCFSGSRVTSFRTPAAGAFACPAASAWVSRFAGLRRRPCSLPAAEDAAGPERIGVRVEARSAAP